MAFKTIFQSIKNDFGPRPKADASGLWLTGTFVSWANILEAKFVWRFGLPFLRLRILSDSKFVYKRPEAPLFYRKLDDLRAEVMQHCPVDHVLREVLPMTLPDRPYRAIYYGQMAMVVIVWFAFIFGLFWILKPSST